MTATHDAILVPADELKELRAQRDELLAAARAVVAHARPSNWNEIDEEFENESRAIIKAWKKLHKAIARSRK